MTTNEVRALVVACLLVVGILVGIAIGRAQVWQEVDAGAGIAHLRSDAAGAVWSGSQ